MPVRLKNNSRGLLAATITELETVIRLRVGHGDHFPSLGAEEWFPLVLEDDQGNREITKATARSGDAITIRRAQEGTTARQFGAGTLVSLRLTPNALASWFNGEDPPEETEADPDYGGTGLIFNGLIVNGYHTEPDGGMEGQFHPNSGTAAGQFLLGMAAYHAQTAIKDYDADHQPGPNVLSIGGKLAGYRASQAYEGRLQISNAVGVCQVQQTGGDTLPKGSEITVNQYTRQIVITWPAYAQLPGDPLFNGDFERGDTGWIKGSGWAIEPVGDGNDGKGSYVGVYRGQGTNYMEQTDYTEVSTGLQFPVKVNVQQGASRAGNCGAGIGLRYYDVDKNLIGEQLGEPVWSGAKARWHFSDMISSIPSAAKYTRAIIAGGRVSENHPLWVDDASWSIPQEVGTNTNDVINLTLRVTDSSGAVATWSGRIGLPWQGGFLVASRDSVRPPSWKYIPWAARNAFLPISMPDGSVRYLAGGHDGLIYYSDDAMDSWVRSDTTNPDQTANYHYGFVFNARDKVLLTFGHYVAVSRDHAKTWNRLYTPYDSFWSAGVWVERWNCFFVVGGGSYTQRILKINAAATTWERKSQTGNYSAIVYNPVHNTVVALGNFSGTGAITLAWCNDGVGNAWNYVASHRFNGGIAILPNGDMIARVFPVRAARSTDGGKTWSGELTTADLNIPDAAYNNALSALWYHENDKILAAIVNNTGTGVSVAKLYFSYDSGVTWVLAPTQPTDFGFTGTDSGTTQLYSSDAAMPVSSDTDSNPTYAVGIDP